MKHLFKYIISSFILISVSCIAQEKFTIKGKITGLPDGTKLKVLYSDVKPADTVTVYNGTFKISGFLKEPIFASIMTESDWDIVDRKLNISYQNFIIDKGETTIEGPSIEDANILGGPVQTEFAESGLGIFAIWMYQAALPNYWATIHKDSLLLKLWTPIVPIRVNKFKVTQRAYVLAHPDSFVSLWAVSQTGNPESKRSLYTVLSSKMKNTDLGKLMATQLKLDTEVGIGKVAPNFTQADVSGKLISLASFKGKYILVDFWASWCGPCRLENPNLVKAYKRFKKKNFEIIGISLDYNRSLWTDAIKKDELSWINLSDLQFHENVIAKAWGVVGVPSNFLIDPNGFIIAKNLRGDKLELKLREIFQE
ncbi:TlpA disulfide reductase family protein [Pedobacter sp. L105]|uniref:TlpA disulfide reductase family protein n=1 Tax=Pedobacter sp. L105 TaxID=1641871 RepID=UPI00131A9756|nr:TlpA disulfide reductase family protein [Pedobacter sp. L105]